MSEQQPPNNVPFVPPPPPVQDSMYSPATLSVKAAQAASDARNALIMSIIGFFCFGFILGILAFRKANDAIETIDIYEVARDKRGMAVAAKVLAIVDIVLWVVGLIAKFALR